MFAADLNRVSLHPQQYPLPNISLQSLLSRISIEHEWMKPSQRHIFTRSLLANCGAEMAKAMHVDWPAGNKCAMATNGPPS